MKFKKKSTLPILTKVGTKHLWKKGIHVCSNEEPHPSPRGDNNEIAKIHWRNFKIFSRTTGQISTSLWVTRIHVCSNEGPRPFPMGDNNEFAEIHWRNLKIIKCSSLEPVGQFQLSIIILAWGRFKGFFCQMMDHTFPTEDNNEIAEIHWRALKMKNKTTGPI